MNDVSQSVSSDQQAAQRSNIKRHSLRLFAAALGFYASYFLYMIVYTSGH